MTISLGKLALANDAQHPLCLQDFIVTLVLKLWICRPFYNYFYYFYYQKPSKVESFIHFILLSMNNQFVKISIHKKKNIYKLTTLQLVIAKLKKWFLALQPKTIID